ncbi:uncharacterized protein FIBRA_05170 [Fibroporia radiculosa]|uniref:Uncharacterized protein n=1 Tax=Fibroporia radiculosa TaxID=599839 RepID=J4IAK1_9APHY|nr:uncharacterized protein FIBRA_05170 [Fibroporia radiculosa]CCM03051.1 predicted protein [Fibroporia radiculosa]
MLVPAAPSPFPHRPGVSMTSFHPHFAEGAAPFSDSPIFEPDEKWKAGVRKQIEDELRPIVEQVRNEHNRSQISRQQFDEKMGQMRALAQHQFSEALMRERQERLWASGQQPSQPWLDVLVREQTAAYANAQASGGRQQAASQTTFTHGDENVAGSSKTTNAVHEDVHIPPNWYQYGEGRGEAPRASGAVDGTWSQQGTEAPYDGVPRWQTAEAQAKAHTRSAPEIWRPSGAPADHDPRLSRPLSRAIPAIKPPGTPLMREHVRLQSMPSDHNIPFARPVSRGFHDDSYSRDGDGENALMHEISIAMAKVGGRPEEPPKMPQVRHQVPTHFTQAHHLAARAQSVTPKPAGVPVATHRVAPTPLRAVENMHYEQPPIAHRATPMETQFSAAMHSALRASTTTPHPGPRLAPSNSTMQVVDPRTFTIDDDARSVNSVFRPPPPPSQALWSGPSARAEAGSAAEKRPTPTLEELVLIASDEGDSDWEASAFETEDVERMMKEEIGRFEVAHAPAQVQVHFEEPVRPKEKEDETKKWPPRPTIVEEVVEEVENVKWPPKPSVVEEVVEDEETPKKPAKGGKGKRKDDAKKKEQETKQKAQEAKRKEQEAKQKEEARRKEQEEARRKEQEARQMEQEARRLEEEKRREEEQRKAEEARRREAEVRQMMEEAKKREQLRKREEELREADRLDRERLEAFRREQEEARRRLDHRQRKESVGVVPEAAKKQDEQGHAKRAAEMAKREEDMKWKEEEMRRREEELKRKELELAKRERQDEVKRKEEEKRKKPGAIPKKKEDELRDKEKELRKQAEELHKKEEELRRREEALNRRAEEVLTFMKTAHDEFRRDWHRMGGILSSSAI